ncbi:undecaprenyl/decaprenyl-phosphate alpha-N-acetylglucosaminyl 1-phosphate transferase [Patescibacteria group bacterium]|nr:undecaprenyl/decaprenyl-phosphate alpha-N-acetylglucosaminyl 1-phosphate transferase [Patescibacteria group bacterium]MBU1682739.1 undecaprenyl/decaprenyl-phosphate alpha-N-acetylglucosaminyl 1-phosphate transferase [Patescibacteria group bacterium]MBU1935473.1 undecaprenyl/decaprenyl-phosphate alpha-N-acetylglucosaminyl 1-phosphate transferase [Patescibacteria group bacterium]
MQYLFPAASAFVLTILSVLIALKVFPKLGLLDKPEKYGLKRKPIPYPGGILLYLIFVLLALMFFEPTMKLAGLLVGGGILVLVSFIDDRMDLPAWFRLLIQVIVALIMVVVGLGVETITNPFGGYIALNQFKFFLQFGDATITIMALSGLFTIAWILLITNTMNWLDGIPGLVSGITVIGGLTLFFLSISEIVNQPEVATLALIVAMIALAFWIFDFHPPKIILGDSGSMFFGLLLAVLAIFSGGKIATAFLILGFPIMDAVYVIIHRIYNKQAPWKGGEWDKQRKAVHLHHRMLEFGLSERQVLGLIYLLATVFGISALFLGTQGKFWAIITIFGLSFVIGVVLRAKKKK